MRRPVQLVDGQTEQLVDAELTRFQSPERLVDIEEAWERGRDWQLFKPSTNIDWSWINKRASIVSGTGILCDVTCQNEPQGAIKLDASPRRSRLNANADVIYVEYLESAPWNVRNTELMIVPRFYGVGRLLIAEAIFVSRDAGFGGRISLHSLPNAEQFYCRSCQFTEVGPDPAENNLVYFECTQPQAIALLEKMGQEL